MESRQGLKLSVEVHRRSWTTPVGHTDDTDQVFKHTRQKVLERDHYTCQFCRFESKPQKVNGSCFLEVHHKDHDHDNNHESNLVTACCLCHQCFHVNHAAKTKGGKLIWLPELTQVELIKLMRTIFIAKKVCGTSEDETKILEWANGLEASLSGRDDYLNNIIPGGSNGELFGQVLLALNGKPNQAILDGIRMLPLADRFEGAIDLWASEQGPYRTRYPAAWKRMVRDRLPSVKSTESASVVESATSSAGPVVVTTTKLPAPIPTEPQAQEVAQSSRQVAHSMPLNQMKDSDALLEHYAQEVPFGDDSDLTQELEEQVIEYPDVTLVKDAILEVAYMPAEITDSRGLSSACFDVPPIFTMRAISDVSQVPLLYAGRISFPVSERDKEKLVAAKVGAVIAGDQSIGIDLNFGDIADEAWHTLQGSMPFTASQSIIPIRFDWYPASSPASDISTFIDEAEYSDLVKFEMGECGHRCRLCGAPADTLKPIWDFQDEPLDSGYNLQSLEGFTVVCKPCDDMLSDKVSTQPALQSRLKQVNRWTDSELEQYITFQRRMKARRDDEAWALDLNNLNGMGESLKIKQTWADDDAAEGVITDGNISTRLYNIVYQLYDKLDSDHYLSADYDYSGDIDDDILDPNFNLEDL